MFLVSQVLALHSFAMEQMSKIKDGLLQIDPDTPTPSAWPARLFEEFLREWPTSANWQLNELSEGNFTPRGARSYMRGMRL